MFKFGIDVKKKKIVCIKRLLSFNIMILFVDLIPYLTIYCFVAFDISIKSIRHEKLHFYFCK